MRLERDPARKTWDEYDVYDYDDFSVSEKQDFLNDFEDILERLEDAADDLC